MDLTQTEKTALNNLVQAGIFRRDVYDELTMTVDIDVIPELLTVTEAAEKIKSKKYTIYSAIKTGEIKGLVKLNGRFLIPAESLKTYIVNRKK